MEGFKQGRGVIRSELLKENPPSTWRLSRRGGRRLAKDTTGGVQERDGKRG